MTKGDKLTAVLGVVNKAFGKGSFQLMRDGQEEAVKEVVPIGIDVVDRYLFAVGGLPVGRIIELYSEEGAGKTSLGHTFLAAAQRIGGVAALFETEYAFDPERAETFGVNVEDLLFCQPDCVEDTLRKIEALLTQCKAAKLGPIVIVWDSIAATPSEAEYEAGVCGDAGFGAERAKALSQAMRLLVKMVSNSRAVLVCVNQIRDKIGVMFGDKYTTSGGHAVKFAATIRLQVFGGKAVKKKGEHVARATTILCTKNRLAPPYRKARVLLDYAHGWNDQWTTLDFAKTRGLVEKRARGAKAHNEALEKLGWPKRKTDASVDDEELNFDEEESESSD